MITHRFLFGFLPISALCLVGCERSPPQLQPSETPAVPVPPTPKATTTSAESTAAPTAAPLPKLDMGALDGRRDPGRLLRFYAAALQARDWSAAARAWGASSGVTASTLRSSYDRAEPPTLEVGKGEVEGAAGSLYYEAPVVLRFGDEPPEKGTLTLRRVNDVPGATPEQRRWHIERVTIGVGE